MNYNSPKEISFFPQRKKVPFKKLPCVLLVTAELTEDIFTPVICIKLQKIWRYEIGVINRQRKSARGIMQALMCHRGILNIFLSLENFQSQRQLKALAYWFIEQYSSKARHICLKISFHTRELTVVCVRD